MTVLILTADYPQPGSNPTMYFVHTRNKYYLRKGLDLEVLSFAAKKDYVFEGVKVFTKSSIENRIRKDRYALVVAHSPNIRNHYLFLQKYKQKIGKVVFFFHGHEILKRLSVYPAPFPYKRKGYLLTSFGKKSYDFFKLNLWRAYFKNNLDSLHFVFVSHWMQDMFARFINLEPKTIVGKTDIIYNCVGSCFEESSFNPEADKTYDFITVRSDLDDAKYAVDIVNSIAQLLPQYRFCLVGKGDYFRFNQKAANLVHLDQYLSHDGIIALLNKARCALMPTRTDAQGVMACEMATFGMPLLTSDIAICREVFSDFDNVAFIDHDNLKAEAIAKTFSALMKRKPRQKTTRYFAENTVGREVKLFQKLLVN